jgi:hypothetical protein
MGVLSDYFIAGADDLEAVGADGELPEAWPRIDAKGFGIVPLEELAKRLKTKAALANGDPPVHGEDYEWVVMQLTPAFVKALAKLSKPDIAKLAPSMAKIEELGWPVKDTARVIEGLNGLAKKAGKKNLYLWTST